MSSGARSHRSSRTSFARRAVRGDRRETYVAAVALCGYRRLLLRRRGLGRAPDADAFRPRRARDHRRQQLVRRRGEDGGGRRGGFLGRRRRVDRRLLRGERLRATERREYVIDGVRTLPLTLHEDERGWFAELVRASALPKPIKQANLSRSRAGVVRGLHYHERGQDDVFVCLSGMVRVVVLDRTTGERVTA